MVQKDLKISLDAAFIPKSVAVLGASNSLEKLGGADFSFLKSNFKGKLYPINSKEKQVQGYEAFQSILDVPDIVDRAVIAVPGKFVLQAVKECAEKGVKVAQIYSAGFGEFGDKGKAIEQEIVSTAVNHGMRIIGPNCIGTYCPKGGISFVKETFQIKGNVAFISQSGGIAFDMVTRGKINGINYSKVISVGNCIDLDHSDYLEYLRDDEDTKIIGFYIESVKDGRRFMKQLKEATDKKPVVILKGGRTGTGGKSVASHTGSLAGDYKIWETMFAQSGAICVKNIDEMLTVLLGLQDVKLFNEGGVAIVGNGGGATVLASDYCDELNLKLAKVNTGTIRKLTELGVVESGRNSNPIDMPAYQLAAEDGKLFGKVIKALDEDPEVRHILFHVNLMPIKNYMNLGGIIKKILAEIDVLDRSRTNVIVALRYNGDPEIENIRYEAARMLQEKAVPVFMSVEQAAFGLHAALSSSSSHKGC